MRNFPVDGWRAILIVLLMAAFIPIPAAPTHAQGADSCGVVDAIDYPIDGVSIEHDDFGMYRAGFDGRHTGIDMAFDRYGDPVRAAARGRVTFSDPKGWDTEKGVVIIEHVFPDDSIFFTLYGHMEELSGHNFPKEGQCVELGDVIGAVGHPSRGAPHLHYEVRKMKASTGGPGYWPVDPLDGGWLHPIDFTEQWQLRLSPAFRKMITAGGGPTSPPLWLSDGGAIFPEEYHLERRTARSETPWRLDVQHLVGIIQLPDGRLLGRTADDQIVVVEYQADDARFVASWKADRPLRSPPLRLGDSTVFVTESNQVVSYDPDGGLRWQTQALGDYIEHYVQSGNVLAISAAQSGAFKLWAVDASGAILFQATAPAPVSLAPAPKGGFLVMVASQVSWLDPNFKLTPLMDVGQALGRGSQIALDPAGNVVVYLGRGQTIYSYNATGTLRWQAQLTGPQRQPPLLAVGAGCLTYVLTDDGALLAYRSSDGALRGMAALYPGGNNGHPASRFLTVSADDQVQFSAGYLSLATVDGLTLAGMKGCKG